MNFKQLTETSRDFIKSMYTTMVSREQAQELLALHFGVSTRTIRSWAKQLGLTGVESNPSSKVMIYDIETSRTTAKVWWTGKQFVGHKQLQSEPAIISICYKWLGDEKVYTLTWDKNKCDKKMLKSFLKAYNTADMVIGQNNDKFDNRWVNARAMKHNLDVNTMVKSFDIMKQTKKLFRLPSYSMDYITKYIGVENKMQHEGIVMWDKIEEGTKSEQKEYLGKMVEYNIQDIICTEQMYTKLRKYMGHKVHFGVLNGQPKYSSPTDGSTDLELVKTTTTAAGTIQHIMRSKTDGTMFKLNNRNYLEYINR